MTIINFPTDILDILIVTFLIYKVLNLAKSRSTAQIVKAVLFLLVLSYVSNALNFHALNYIISKTIEVGLIALVVVWRGLVLSTHKATSITCFPSSKMRRNPFRRVNGNRNVNH